MKVRTLMIGVALAGGVAVGYWLGNQRHQPRLVPADGLPTNLAAGSSTPEVSAETSAAARKAVEEARAQHFEQLHSVQEALALPSAFARREALYALGGRADAHELAALIAEANTLPNRAGRAAALDVLYLRYVERNPEGALRSVLAQPDSEARNENLERVAAAWARVAPQSAFQQATLEADPETRALLQNAIITVWASQDPAAAFAVVVTLPTQQRMQLLRATTRELVRQDPQRAVELIATLRSREDAQLFTSVFAAEWANRDVRAAARWVASTPRERNAMSAYIIAPIYAARFPVEGLEWASRIDRNRNGAVWAQALGGLAEADPDMALRLATAVPESGRRSQALMIVVVAIARRDPTLAMRYYEKLPAGQSRSQLATGIATTMARTDPAAAIAWIVGLGDANARMEGLGQIGSDLAQRDVSRAIDLTDQVPAEFRARWIASIGNAYAQEDVDTAVQWMRKNEAVPGYSAVLPEFLSNLATQDADAAFELAAGIADDRQRDSAIETVVNTVAQISPSEAARWIGRIRDDEAQRSAVSQIAAGWVRFDSDAARKWVLSLDSSILRDPGLVQLISAGSLDDIEPLLGQIQSPDLRMDAVLGAAFRLAGEDMQAARTLLRHHPLDPRRQQQFEFALRQNLGKSW
jgi:hypothetical protein